MSAQTLNGSYRLVGIHDMATGFNFSPDGHFQFFYIYGVSDRNATGTYTIEGDTVKLKSDKEPGKDFQVELQQKKGKGYTIQVKSPNPHLLQPVICFYYIGEQQHLAEADREGRIYIDADHVDKLFIRHEYFPDIPTLIKDTDNTNNYFEVSLLPSLEQVSFKGIDLFIKEEELTCYPNYFMPFENITFIKE